MLFEQLCNFSCQRYRKSLILLDKHTKIEEDSRMRQAVFQTEFYSRIEY